MAINWEKLQDELDADAARILNDCTVQADALYAEVYGDLYTRQHKVS